MNSVNSHEAIVDARTFAITRELRTQRTRSNYRGVKKYENAYSGLIYCGECGSPMFSMSRADLRPAKKRTLITMRAYFSPSCRQ